MKPDASIKLALLSSILDAARGTRARQAAGGRSSGAAGSSPLFADLLDQAQSLRDALPSASHGASGLLRTPSLAGGAARLPDPRLVLAMLSSSGLAGSPASGPDPLGGSPDDAGARSLPAQLLAALGLAGTSAATRAPLGGQRAAVVAPIPRAGPAIAWARTRLGRQNWNGLCEQFVEEAYGTRGVYPTAAAAGKALVRHRGPRSWESAPVGALLYFRPDESNQYNGHAAIYVGNGKMISATPRGVVEERIDQPYWANLYVGWGTPDFAPAPPSGAL